MHCRATDYDRCPFPVLSGINPANALPGYGLRSMPVSRIHCDRLGNRRLYRSKFVSLRFDPTKHRSINAGLQTDIVAFEQQPCDKSVAPVLVENRRAHLLVEFLINQKLHDTEQENRNGHADVVGFEPDSQLDRIMEQDRERLLLKNRPKFLPMEQVEMLHQIGNCYRHVSSPIYKRTSEQKPDIFSSVCGATVRELFGTVSIMKALLQWMAVMTTENWINFGIALGTVISAAAAWWAVSLGKESAKAARISAEAAKETVGEWKKQNSLRMKETELKFGANISLSFNQTTSLKVVLQSGLKFSNDSSSDATIETCLLGKIYELTDGLPLLAYRRYPDSSVQTTTLQVFPSSMSEVEKGALVQQLAATNKFEIEYIYSSQKTGIKNRIIQEVRKRNDGDWICSGTPKKELLDD